MLPTHVTMGLRMGLFPPEALIRWADARIAENPSPPEWLIDLATASPDRYSLEDVLKKHGMVQEVDDEIFLALAAHALDEGLLPLDRIVTHLYVRFCQADRKEMTPLIQEVYLIDQDWDWQPEEARKRCIAFLAPHRAKGAELAQDFPRE